MFVEIEIDFTRCTAQGSLEFHADEFVTFEEVYVGSVKKFTPWVYCCKHVADKLDFENELFFWQQLENNS